ncbi:hypothetical protein PPERSA_11431 [Pseudocohnilembus persalinus]|uniref:Phospholipase/carboxylesterase/thioesterase domain-containing protein n=1 Tax=Pseudocohnilembus persalinus TaxID=266149 RepID=A0A0V0QX19_PSEPJ|nr:hypothetical protein PPERSA_11431 [Pseudocohnilembus persalinus]|eukprot:KRX06786.1 hypothetical protein PPERSA_11431 [Pseudocohnilembus persalinus]
MQQLEKIAKNFAKNNTYKATSQFVSKKDYQIVADKQEQKITFHPLKEHKNTLIWLHGLGDSADGFAPIFASPQNFTSENTKIILPTAPTRKVTINGGYPCTAWYDIVSLERNENQSDENLYNQEQVNESVQYVSDIIDNELSILNGKNKNIYIGGFSQGGVMALATAYTYPQILGGVFSHSGYLISSVKLQHKLNVGLIHGKQDQVVVFKYGWGSYSRIYDDPEQKIESYIDDYMGHEVTLDSLGKLKQWFAQFNQQNQKDQQ